MNKKTLRELFEEMHHGKHDFEEFLYADVSLYYRQGRATNFLIPNKKLKAFHTFLNLFVFEFLPIEESAVFSYRKGFSAFDAVRYHAKSKYFFQTDVSSFFGSVGRQLVRDTLLAGIEYVPVQDIESHVERILDWVCVDNKLPIGFPSSAPISNAVLYGFDQDFAEFCKSRSIVYTRYSDDIIISAQEKTSLADIDRFIEVSLQSVSEGAFKLNSKKTKFFQVGGKIKILGMMILPNGKITIDSAVKRHLEVLLYTYISDRQQFLILSEGEEERGLGRTTGYLNYSNSVDPDYVDKLRRKFGATTVDTLLHRPLPKTKPVE